MDFYESFQKRIFNLGETDFEYAALSLFRQQAKDNAVYNQYISNLNISPDSVSDVADIPFMPISFFKQHVVKTGNWNEEVVFSSSGTTGQVTSRHYVKDQGFYLENCVRAFERMFGDISKYHVLGLLPSYLEREGSSLVCMVERFIQLSHSQHSGFYLHNHHDLLNTLSEIRKKQAPVLLIGVTFALLDLAEKYNIDLAGVVVMETGGMKGKRKEMIREELYGILKTQFKLENIYSEYGMTELLSQAYSHSNGDFSTPPWMKVIFRDLNDPFDIGSHVKRGGINIIDLANIYSCAFIETQDVGSRNPDGSFKVLGRFDNSDVRGCNLLIG